MSDNKVTVEALEAFQDDAGYTLLDIPVDAYVVYADELGYDMSDFDDWRDAAHEAYEGEFDSDEDFAQELAEAIEGIPLDTTWPLHCIDWEQAARELMFDYFEGDNYYFRSM